LKKNDILPFANAFPLGVSKLKQMISYGYPNKRSPPEDDALSHPS
jgi:hypothetical protein